MRKTDRSSIFQGAVLTVSMRWIDRLLGLVSTLILARLLIPEDFGIVAMASLVIGLLDVLLDLGVNIALIQNRNAEQAHYDTAWTLRLIQTLVTAGVVVATAPFAADYFGDTRVTPVLQLMGIGLILVGLENIGVVCFQKEMKFHLDFRYLFLKRLAGFLTTIVAAWFMRSYWALVIGALAGRSFGTILSYLIHPMRPRLSLQKFDDIFSVSQWMLVRSIGAYLNKNLHMFFVGNRADTATMGGYSLADQISAMPTTELLAPLNRVLFPAFVQARENISELKRLFLLAQGVQTLAAIPAAVGLALVAHEAVLILLGEKWLIAVPFVEWLALGSAFSAIATSGGYILITMGKVKDAAVVTWANVALFVIGALVLSPEAGALDLAKLRLATVVLGLLLALILLKRTLVNLSSLDMLRTVYRPIIGASAMAVAIGSAPFSSTIAPLVALQLKIGIGLVVFPATVLFVWWFAGKPEGAERYLLEKAVYITRNFRS